ncbi:MAG: diguanylate cyclase [Chloroflexi bacterium]|nr:diguanylate cyclase [Chloroflexota bacterium]
MESQMIIPLLATAVYMVPLAVLLITRPWPKQGLLFLVYLIPAMLYSLADFLFRAEVFANHERIAVKVIICLAILMIIQFHFVLRSYATSRLDRMAFLAYLILAATIILVATDFMPRLVDTTGETSTIKYGVGIIPIVVGALALVGHDLLLLRRRFKASAQVMERNQLTYLLLATLVGAAGMITSLTDVGTKYATAHIGVLGVALIIVYAIAAHRLMDVGAALRRVLVFFWLTVIIGVAYAVLYWLASIAFDFQWQVKPIAASIGVAFLCVILVYLAHSFLREAVEGLFVGRKHSYRQQLHEFISTTYGITDLDAFGQELLTLICRSTDSRQAWLIVPSLERGGLDTRASYSLDENDAPAQIRIREDSPIHTRLMNQTEPLSKLDLQILPEFASLWDEERKEIETAGIDMLFPIRNDDRLAGILALSRKRRRAILSLEEIDLIFSALNRFAAAIEKESMREELQAKEEELVIFNRLMSILSSSMDIQEAFDRFSEELEKVAPVDWATIALAEGNELVFLALSSTSSSPWQVDQRIPLAGTGAEWVMTHHKSLYEPDLVKQSRFVTADKHTRQGIRSIVYLPLVSGGRSIGSLTVASNQPGAYNMRQVKLLEQLATHITTPIENSQLYHQAREKARVDELTTLFNRRHFDERLKEELTRQARYGGTFSLLMLDLDAFKVYNDIFGHPAGDQLLREVSGLIKACIRTSDQAFRYGGDEFAVILPHIDTDAAYHVAERVRQTIAHQMQLASTGVAASIGVANCPEDGTTAADMVTVADTALYYAKYNGGNRTYLPAKVRSTLPVEATRETRSPSLAAIYALTTAVDAKDHYTYTHSHQVRGYALALAEAIGSPPDLISRLSAASLLHDIGKIGVSDRILTTKDPLTEDELAELRTHPRLGVTIISNMPGLSACVPAILHHHENYDGSGYPDGLKGEAIPLEARILCLANAFADMTSYRPHHDALSWDEALEEITRCAGSQFDPRLARAFVEAVRSGAIAKTLESEKLEEIQVPVANGAAPKNGGHGGHGQ